MSTTSFLILAAILLIAILLMIRATRAFNAQLRNLSAGEAKIFNELIRQKSRAEMPARFSDLAASAVRARRTYILGMLAIIGGITYVIIAGP